MFAQNLRIHRIYDTEMLPTGSVIKAPVAGFQSTLERVIKVGQWVYWPGLLIFVLAVNRLINAHRAIDYQFGLTTVELASFTRRSIARVIDYFQYALAGYLVTFTYGMSSQEQVEKDLDRFFDWSPNGLLLRWAWMVLTLLLSYLFILIINSWLQGRWGVTLGKWLCGIRTVRSTLRPCGFLRAMLRELLLLVDTLLSASYVPATLVIAFTSCRQRIGDLVADTIVIRKPVECVIKAKTLSDTA